MKNKIIIFTNKISFLFFTAYHNTKSKIKKKINKDIKIKNDKNL